MIAVSLLLIVSAASLLGLGLWQSSSGLLSGSIAASLLAAIVLVVGVRRTASPRTVPDHAAPRGREREPEPERPAERSGERTPERSTEPVTMTIPAQGTPGRGATGRDRAAGGQGTGREAVEYEPGEYPGTAGSASQAGAADYAEDEDPPDEPAPQQVSAADAARVGRMLTDVLVVDGRPRYHLPGCVHLLGRESEPLPVGEAIELGFTPCSLCEPDSALLADARRV